MSGPGAVPGGAPAAKVRADQMADGQWHRLHPATPLLRGGIGFIAVLGFVIANLRERLTNMMIGMFGGQEQQPRGPRYDGDPIDQLVNHGLVGWALLVLAVLLLLALAGFYVSWRVHSFRIGDDAVEVRSGILSRRHRNARLDRIQGVNVSRPLFARLFGTAKLEVSVAGQDANVDLAYLGSAVADELRRDILRRASGARIDRAGATAGPRPEDRVAVGAAGPAPSGVVANRLAGLVDEFGGGPFEVEGRPPASVVRIPHGRLIGAIVLHGFTIGLLVIVALLIVTVSLGQYWMLFAVLPGVLGSVGFYGRRFAKSVNFTIADTPDGVRVGFGLLSTTNETLPPGRIHAVEVLQPLLWRPFGWWQIRINTAGHSSQKGAAGQPNTTVLPVGDLVDAGRVLALILPALGDLAAETKPDGNTRGAHPDADADADADAAGGLPAAALAMGSGLVAVGLTGGPGNGYTGAPRRARWLRPFSWQRTGYAVHAGVVLLRSGALWRRLVVVPLARMQSIEVRQGPLRRMLQLASAELHTVEGPVNARLSVIDPDASLRMFAEVAEGAVAWAGTDTSHRWNAHEGLTRRVVGEDGPE